MWTREPGRVPSSRRARRRRCGPCARAPPGGGGTRRGASRGAAGVLVLLYASLIERRWYALRHHTVACLPPGAAPLRLLHISDLHLRAPQRKEIAFIRRLARVQPDIVVSTGDF